MIDDFKEYKPMIHGTAFIAPSASVIGMVEIEEDGSVWHGVVLRGDVEKIVIGKGANIQDNCVLHCSEGIITIVGEGVTVGHGAVLHSCSIGENTLIGMGAVILDGASIGKDCMVAAGSLVTPGTVIPDGSMAMGSPAKVRRALTEEEIKGIRHNAEEYISLKNIYRGK